MCLNSGRHGLPITRAYSPEYLKPSPKYFTPNSSLPLKKSQAPKFFVIARNAPSERKQEDPPKRHVIMKTPHIQSGHVQQHHYQLSYCATLTGLIDV